MPEEHEYYREVLSPMLEGQADEFVGEADAALKRQLFAGARALLVPLQWDEPFGLVMIEAMACGTPVIAFPRGAAPEIVVDGKTGFLVEPDDVDTLAHRLLQLLSDEALRATQGAAARERVAACYTFDRFRTTLSDLLKADE